MKLPRDPQIQEAYAQLLLDDRMVFEHAYARKSKGIGAVYLAWLCASHYIYLGRQDLQNKYWFSLGGLLIWAIIDLARIPGMVNDYNRDIARINLEPFKGKSHPIRSHPIRSHPAQSQAATLEPIPPASVLAKPVLVEPVLVEPVLAASVSSHQQPVETIPANQHAVIELVFQ